MKLYKVEFKGMWPVGNCLIIQANNKKQATEIAEATVSHTNVESVKRIKLKDPGVVVYMDGNY